MVYRPVILGSSSVAPQQRQSLRSERTIIQRKLSFLTTPLVQAIREFGCDSTTPLHCCPVGEKSLRLCSEALHNSIRVRRRLWIAISMRETTTKSNKSELI